MRGTRSAILAFCAVAVFADAAAAQDAALPPANVPAPVVSAAASADAAGVGIRVGATVGTSGDASRSPSTGASANAGAAGADVAAGAAAAPEAAPIAVDIRVSTGTSEPAPRAPSSVDASGAEPLDRSEKPSARIDRATPASRHASAPAPRPKRPTGSVAMEIDDRVVSAAASLRTQDADERRAFAPSDDVDANVGGGSPEEAVSSSGGISSAATVLSLAVLLIPLVTWAFEQAAAGSPRTFFASLLERPG